MATPIDKTPRQRYEMIYGEIPKGHVLVFLDGNKDNANISNLEVMNRSDFMRFTTCGGRKTLLQRILKIFKN